MNAYAKKMSELNTKNYELQKRVKRCTYLKQRLDLMVNCRNREQAQAYAARLNWHKPKLIDQIEELEKLEAELEQMPRTWIV